MIAAAEGFSFATPLALLVFCAGLALLGAAFVLGRQFEWGVPTAGIYLLFGAVAAVGINLLGITPLDPLRNAALIERLTEIAILVALFTGALKIKRAFGLREWRSPILLLLVVMPLTIAGVALFASAALGLSLAAAVLLGAILAPTDPVLAGEVGVEEVGDGEDEEHRFALSSEAGLNDGFAFPFIFLGIFIATGSGSWFGEWLAADVFYAIGGGLLLGAVLGRLLGKLIDAADGRGWVPNEAWIAVAVIMIIYGASEWLGVYGFLAVFAGGLAYRRRPSRSVRHYRDVYSGAESLERIGELALMVLLGSMLTFSGLLLPGVWGWLLVLALIFVIRPAAVFLAFVGSRLSKKEKVFLGWFGIRGIGSLYYAAVVVGSGALATEEMNLVLWTTLGAIVLSVLLHGLSAEPLTRKLHLHEEGKEWPERPSGGKKNDGGAGGGGHAVSLESL